MEHNAQPKKHFKKKAFHQSKGFGKNTPFGEKKSPRSQGQDKRFSAKDRRFNSNAEKPIHSKFEYKKEEPKGVSLARLTALRVVQDITVRKAYTSLALNDVLSTNSLSEVDKRLCTHIVYSTIENLIRLDYIIDAFLEHKNIEPILRDVLRIGAAQLLFMDKIPDFAIINESVKLIRIVSMVEPWAGLVNAVLRNIVRHKETFAWPKEEDDFELYLSVTYSIPLWLVGKLLATFGKEKAIAFMSHQKESNLTCIRRNTMAISKEAFEALLHKKGWVYEQGLVDDAYLIKNIDSIAEDEDYQKGLFSVQGQSSMLAAMAVDTSLGKITLDACAAPGGKTFFLAEKQQGSGRVFAWDIYAHRVELIRQSMYRLHLGNVRVAQCDATKYREDLFEYFDRVLLDVPCSNLGMMFEKPDVKYHIENEETMEQLLQTQYKILENCANYLKVGGTLVYSTCSILPEENTKQIQKFLEKHSNFSLLPMPNTFPETLRILQEKEGLTIFPQDNNLEGFFIARLQKNA